MAGGAILLAAVLVGCGSTPAAATTLRTEPVSSIGDNPFTPSVGAGQPVTPPSTPGGTIAGNTVGLFGGTEKLGSCNPHQLVTFLQAHPDKAAAWAAVLGITPANIPTFVSTLTSVVLRSDTAVINHGFVNGHATAVPSVLQAGTAVLVDRHGNPVTRCACGNPLTAPTAFTRVVFTGPTWPAFSSTSITIVAPVTVVINNFVLVEPNTGTTFERPAGSQGPHDSQLKTGNPPNPSNPAIPPTTTAPAAPPTTVPPSSAPPTTVPPSSSPPSSSPPTAGPLVVPPASTTPAPAPTTSAPSTSVPSAKAAPPPPVAPSTSAPKATKSANDSASWVIGTCFVDRRDTPPSFTGTVLVRNNDTTAHSYQVTVTYGNSGPPVETTVSVSGVAPGASGSADATTAGNDSATGPTVPCEITKLVDETGKTPAMGPRIDPPADNPPPDQPTPTTEPPVTEAPTTEAPTTEAPPSTPIPGPPTEAPPVLPSTPDESPS